MISIIITTKDSPETFEKSFKSTLLATKEAMDLKIIDTAEIIIVSPNIYTFLESIDKFNIPIITLTDKKVGKSIAMNQAVENASGEYLIFTDGDILLDKDAISNIYNYLIANNLFIAGGHPVSLESKDTMLGYWSWVLAEGNAHILRTKTEELRRGGKHAFFPVSGYLFIIKKALYSILPTNLLSEDAYLSYNLFQKGSNVGYDEKSIVYVKYPKNFKDYVNQKLRSIGGYNQEEVKGSKVRSLSYEASKGITLSLGYAKNPKEFLWSIALILSRVYIWVLVFYNIKLRKKTDIWKVVESSKI